MNDENNWLSRKPMYTSQDILAHMDGVMKAIREYADSKVLKLEITGLPPVPDENEIDLARERSKQDVQRKRQQQRTGKPF